MASPQKENGYTAIANEIMDHLISAGLSGQEMAITLLVIRKTYGYNKKSDIISLSQMAKAIGSSRIRCSQVVNRLVLMKILTVNENINGILKMYSFNKDFDVWDAVDKNINRIEKTKQTIQILRNKPLIKTLTTKDNITKDNITKENITPLPPLIPDWVPIETFTEYQCSRKRKLKPTSYERFFKHLKKIAQISMASPEEILNQSIVNGWEGIFPLKQTWDQKKYSGIKAWLEEKQNAGT